MKFFKNLLDLIFVPKCGSCGIALPSGDEALCAECAVRYATEKNLKCAVCGYPHIYCKCRISCDSGEIPLVHVAPYSTWRDSVGKRMVLHIKDNATRTLLDKMASDMVEAFNIRVSSESVFCDMTPENTCITWVARSKKAYRKAGHDQSEELAKRISHLLGFPAFSCFVNLGRMSQKKLNSEMRLQNAVSNYILSADNEGFEDKIVIVVDDIVTTGSSIRSCAEQLLANGAKSIIALSFAKTENERISYNDSPRVK